MNGKVILNPMPLKMLVVTVYRMIMKVLFGDFPSVGLCLCTEAFWMNSRSVNFISFVPSLFLLSLQCFQQVAVELISDCYFSIKIWRVNQTNKKQTSLLITSYICFSLFLTHSVQLSSVFLSYLSISTYFFPWDFHSFTLHSRFPLPLRLNSSSWGVCPSECVLRGRESTGAFMQLLRHTISGRISATVTKICNQAVFI